MIVISNTSPLVTLSAINQHDLLPSPFGTILVQTSTQTELQVAGKLPFRAELLAAPWLVTRHVQNSNLVTALRQSLGAGEAEAIALAVESRADLLLMDERLGRRTASRFELPLMGVIGILVLAKTRGLIPEVRPLLHQRKPLQASV